MKQKSPPPSSSRLSVREKLLLSFELFDSGVSLMRQNLRRKFPDLSEDAIEEKLRRWLRTRPGAEFGDSSGNPVAPVE